MIIPHAMHDSVRENSVVAKNAAYVASGTNLENNERSAQPA